MHENISSFGKNYDEFHSFATELNRAAHIDINATLQQNNQQLHVTKHYNKRIINYWCNDSVHIK